MEGQVILRVPTWLGIWGKVGNIILCFPGLELFSSLPWWLGILFRGRENVNVLIIYLFDLNLKLTQVILVKVEYHANAEYENPLKNSEKIQV